MSSILLPTGNVFKFGKIQAKILADPNAEILEGVQNVLKCMIEDNFETMKIESNYLTNENKSFELKTTRFDVQKLNGLNHDRGPMKVSVKLFLYPDTYENLNSENQIQLFEEAILVVQKLLNVEKLDNLVVSIQTEDIDLVIPNTKKFWSTGERFVPEVVNKLGVSDLNCQQLSELCEWTKNVKPSSSQIKIEDCCDIPTDLSKYAKDNSIQLVTHNDPTDDFMPIEQFKVLIKKEIEINKTKLTENEQKVKVLPAELTSEDLKRRWIARYTFTLPSQGVLLCKGYFISLQS